MTIEIGQNVYALAGMIDAAASSVPIDGVADAAAPLNVILATHPTQMIVLRAGAYNLASAPVTIPAGVAMMVLPGATILGTLTAASGALLIRYDGYGFGFTGGPMSVPQTLTITGAQGTSPQLLILYGAPGPVQKTGFYGLNQDSTTVVAGRIKAQTDLIIASPGTAGNYGLLMDRSNNLYAAANLLVGGSVGIGTPTPSVPLHVSGTAGAGALGFSDPSAVLNRKNMVLLTQSGIAQLRSFADTWGAGGDAFLKMYQQFGDLTLVNDTTRIYNSGGIFIGTTPADPGANNLGIRGTLNVIGLLYQNSLPLMHAPVYSRPAQQVNTTVTLINALAVGASDASFDVVGNVNVTASAAAAMTMNCAYTDENNAGQTLNMKFTTIGSTLMAISMTASLAYEGIANRIRCKAGTTITIATAGTVTGITYTAEATVTQVQ